MSFARRMLLGGVKTAAAAADIVAKRSGLVVLIYHRVGGGSALEVDLPVPLFEQQCAHLAETATVMSLGEAIGHLRDDVPMPPRAIAITFDDGTADFAEHAVPILARYHLPATVYVATEFIERQRSFPSDGRPLSWAALADTMSTGFVDVGSHTHSHRVLGDVGAVEAADELDRSTGLIGERLGVVAVDFAYPKAVRGSAAADAAVRARFRSAAVAGGRPNRPGEDLHLLQRTPIQVSDGMRWFRRKVDGGMVLEDVLRRRLNRHRYAGAVS